MYIVNGIAYAGEKGNVIAVREVKPLPDKMMIVTFTTGEKRLFDASPLLSFPAFKRLADENIFMNPAVEYGVVTWADGEIDIAPETMYANGYEYSDILIG